MKHGESTHHIEPGDAVYFDADTTHSYVCTGKTPATAVIVTLQHPLMQLAASSRSGPLGPGKVRVVPTRMGPTVVPKKNSERMQ